MQQQKLLVTFVLCLLCFGLMASATPTMRYYMGAGRNVQGQLGTLQGSTNPATLSRVYTASGTPKLTSFDHSLLVDENTAFGWGSNRKHQLSSSNDTTILAPTQVDMSINSVAVGSDFSLLFSQDGSVYGMGGNAYGQLGDGSTTSKEHLTNLNFDSTLLASFTKVSCFYYSCFAITSDGKVYSWGNNENGQLGNGQKTNLMTPTQASSLSSVACKDVQAGVKHTIFLAENGTLYGMGLSDKGQLGFVSTSATTELRHIDLDAKITQIATSGSTVLALAENGTLYGWGDNSAGQLGVTAHDENVTYVSTPHLLSHQLSEETIIKIVAGRFHTLILTDKGNVYGAGSNGFGQLGLSTSNTSSAFASVFTDHSGSITDVVAGQFNTFLIVDKEIYACGSANSLGVTSFQFNNFTSSTNQYPLANIYAGDGFSLGITDETKTVVGMGLDEYRLSTNTIPQHLLTPVTVYDRVKVSSIAMGGNYSNWFVVARNDSQADLIGWGNTFTGQLNTGNPTFISQPTKLNSISDNAVISKIDASIMSTVAIVEDSSRSLLFGVGDKVALGFYASRNSSATVTTGVDVEDVASGDFHTLFLTTAGSVISVGKNDKGQLGTGNFANRDSVDIASPISFPTGVTIEKLYAGSESSFAVTSAGVFAWGDNTMGTLGVASSDNYVNNATLIPGLQGLNIAKISSAKAGGKHTLAFTADGRLYVWGDNSKGQLGIGSSQTFITTPTLVTLPDLANDVAAGPDYSLIILGTKPCPYNCSGNGICSPGVGLCTCYSQYSGSGCEQSQCPTGASGSQCSGNGACDTTTGQCVCSSGYGGEACQRTLCPNNCSGNGACDWSVGKCLCNPGFTSNQDCAATSSAERRAFSSLKIVFVAVAVAVVLAFFQL